MIHDQYRELSDEENDKKREYTRKRYQITSEKYRQKQWNIRKNNFVVCPKNNYNNK